MRPDGFAIESNDTVVWRGNLVGRLSSASPAGNCLENGETVERPAGWDEPGAAGGAVGAPDG